MLTSVSWCISIEDINFILMIEKKEIIKEKNEITIVKAIDLIKRVKREPEPKMLWRGIPEGSIGLITGVAKTGKTTFAENLAISLSVGKKDFFGSPLDGKDKKVLFINLEEGYKLRSRRNSKQIESLNDKEYKLFSKNYLSTPEEFPTFLNTEEDWEALQEYVIASDAEVVFIDSLSHMLIGEIERSVIAQKFKQTFEKHLSKLGKTIVVVHHNTKGNDKPMDQDSIAGSRFILQEFEYAYGFANIPTGGNYACMLYNKHIEKDDTTAILYKIQKNGWFEYLGIENKFSLYKGSNKSSTYKVDNRIDDTNLNIIYDYMESQSSQGSQYILSSDLQKQFVESNTMSKDTLYKNINKLDERGKIERLKKGTYAIANYKNNEDGKGV